MRAIESQADEVRSGNAGQYAVFAPVTQVQLATIEQARDTRHKGLRFHYFNSEKILIVKIMLGPVEELASKPFGSMLDVKITGMGLLDGIGRMDATPYQRKGSQKEADCSWKPWLFRPLKTDWPTVVIDCGVSQSLGRLKADAGWWLENSMGQVKMVLLVSFSETKREIHIEQWKMVTIPNPHVPQGQPDPARTAPTIMRELDIGAAVPKGAPLMANLQSIFLCPRVNIPSVQGGGQREGNIVFTEPKLKRLAKHVSNHAQ